MNYLKELTVKLVFPLSLILIAACGGGSGNSDSDSGQSGSPSSYTVGGTVSGLNGTGLVLQNNGGDDLSISENGAFTFVTSLSDLATYSISALSQPGEPSQLCSITNDTGTIAGSNVVNVVVECVNIYRVGGTVSGLKGGMLKLQINDDEEISMVQDGSFYFTNLLLDQSAFNVVVSLSPDSPNQTCLLNNNVGVIAGADIEDITATCKRVRVSVDSSGAEANNGSSKASISENGRYIAFESYASNLVPNDTNGAHDIFVHDTETGETSRISVDSNGLQSNGDSYRSEISANGRYITFESQARNLVSGDTNESLDVFVHDRQTGNTIRISVNSDGEEGDGHSVNPSISAEGQWITFQSQATNLISGDTNRSDDIFLYDMSANNISRLSENASGAESNGASEHPDISDDGRYISFQSIANNLVAGDTNGHLDVFLYDRQTSSTSLVSVDSNGAQANNISYGSTISADGRYIAFHSEADNLIIGDTNGVRDVFVHDRQEKVTNRVSVDSLGTEGDNVSSNPYISADGVYVAFDSNATNLVSNDTNNHSDAFVHNRLSGKTIRMSLNRFGNEEFVSSNADAISSDSKYFVFSSQLRELATSDTNGVHDVFLLLMPEE